MNQLAPPLRSPGRPRSFDIDTALDKAIVAFSARGYHATSINDLAEAMELSQGSIYKAFGDKRGVFLAALDRYHAVRTRLLREAVAAGRTGRERVRNGLMFYAEASVGAEGLQGCLVIGSASELAAFDAEVAEKVAQALNRKEGVIADCIREGVDDGSINPGTDAASAARFMTCVLHGMRIAGKTGRLREEMVAVVDIAMRAI